MGNPWTTIAISETREWVWWNSEHAHCVENRKWFKKISFWVFNGTFSGKYYISVNIWQGNWSTVPLDVRNSRTNRSRRLYRVHLATLRLERDGALISTSSTRVPVHRSYQLWITDDDRKLEFANITLLQIASTYKLLDYFLKKTKVLCWEV